MTWLDEHRVWMIGGVGVLSALLALGFNANRWKIFATVRGGAGADPGLSIGRRAGGNRPQLFRCPQDRGDPARSVSRADARHHDSRRPEIPERRRHAGDRAARADYILSQDGGIGQAISAVRARKGGPLRVAVIGLGSGTLTCASEPGETWKFFEIASIDVDNPRATTQIFQLYSELRAGV